MALKPAQDGIFMFISSCLYNVNIVSPTKASRKSPFSNRDLGLFHLRYFENGPLESGYWQSSLNKLMHVENQETDHFQPELYVSTSYKFTFAWVFVSQHVHE